MVAALCTIEDLKREISDEFYTHDGEIWRLIRRKCTDAEVVLDEFRIGHDSAHSR